MHFKYNINGTIIRTWYGYFKDSVDIEDNTDKTIAKLPVVSDNNREYFIYNGQKVYKSDFVKVSFEDFMNAVKENMAFDNMFTTMIMSEGLDNIQFEVPMNTITGLHIFDIGFANGDKFINKTCRIIEREHKVEDNYKIEVEVIDPDETTISHRSFYISDMISLIRSGHIKIMKVA